MPENSEYTRLGDGGNQSLFGRWQYLTRLEKGLILITTVFGIVIFSLAIALAKCDAQAPPITTTVAPDTTTAPSTTTVAPSTTTVAPSTTTVAPSTTTVKPSTTTVAPSTTTVAPSTTTVAPSTTTVAPSTTTVAPSTTTVTPSTTTTKKPTNDSENKLAENVKPLESTTSFQGLSEKTTELLKNIPPIPVTGIKLITPEKDVTTSNKSLSEIKDNVNDSVTSEISTQKYSEVPENNTEKSKRSSDSLLSRKKRIDASSVAEGKKDNPIYE